MASNRTIEEIARKAADKYWGRVGYTTATWKAVLIPVIAEAIEEALRAVPVPGAACPPPQRGGRAMLNKCEADVVAEACKDCTCGTCKRMLSGEMPAEDVLPYIEGLAAGTGWLADTLRSYRESISTQDD